MAEFPKREDLFLTDFATIFANMWYRDFPLQYSVNEKAQRADWTTHIGIAVRSTADLMGLFTGFEHGVRTDAVLKNNQKKPVAALEWEWAALHSEKVTEFDKLKRHCADPVFHGLQFAGLIVYAREDQDFEKRSDEVLETFRLSWTKELPPLLLVVIHYKGIGKTKRNDEGLQARQFTHMTIEKIAEGSTKRLREQRAYPWNVDGSRWQMETGSGTSGG